MTHVLIVEDDNTQRKILARMLEEQEFDVSLAGGGQEALDYLRSEEGGGVDAMLLDLFMPDVGGLEVLASLKEFNPDLPVVVLTAHSEVDRVVEVMRAGASDFIPKPAGPLRLRRAIESAIERRGAAGNSSHFQNKWKGRISFDELIGQSEAMQRAFDMARKGASASVPILIEGESGVGKEMFARAIQSASDRYGKPFVTVNCGAIPANLVESILFGHEKGAFTGASEKHDGKFLEASGGTLFLDEIGELPLDTQVKLLRAIQEGEIDPVGSRTPIKVDIRLISATNKTLLEQVGQGAFREDLMYRLNVFPVRIPPLRERREDIPLLVNHFIALIAESEGREAKPVGAEAMALLQAYDWPGNVRQLENAMFRAVILSDAEELGESDFPQILNAHHKQETATGSGLDRPRPMLAHSLQNTQGGVPDAREQNIRMFDESGALRTLAEVEAEMIERALKHYDGHMSEVARRLGIGRSTLYRKISELGLDENAEPPTASEGNTG